MIYFTLLDVGVAVAGYFLFGILFSLISKSTAIISFLFKGAILLPSLVCDIYDKAQRGRIRTRITEALSSGKIGMPKWAKDLGSGAKLLIFGISFSILNYVLLDGVVRIFAFLIAFLGVYAYALASKTRPFLWTCGIFKEIFVTLLIVISYALFPIYFILAKILRKKKDL